jgi:hypothetical protein
MAVEAGRNADDAQPMLSNPRGRTALIITAVAAALTLAVVEVTGAVIAARYLTDVVVSSRTADAAAVRDEVEVRAVAYAFEEAINDADYDTWSALVCEQMLARFDKGKFLETSVAFREIEDGGLFIIIDSIVVTGDTAIGNVMFLASPPDDVHFVREDGYWKWCNGLPSPR